MADEHRNGTVYHGYAGIGGTDILYLSQDSLYHQCGVNGRLFRGYTVGSDISGNGDVCTGACGVLPVSGTALHRSGTGYDLFRCGVCLFLAIGDCTTGIPAAGHTDSAFIEVVDTEDEGKRRNSPYRRQSIVRHCSNRYTVRYIIRYIARHRSIPEQCHPPRMESHCHQSRHPAGAGRGNLPLWLTLQLYVCSQPGTQSTGCRSRPLPFHTQPGVRTMAGCRPADFGLCPNARYPRSPRVDEKRRGYRYTLHPFRLRDACSARRNFRIHPVCRHGRIPQLQGIARSKLARDACRKRCPPACRNSIPAAARSVGRCVVRSRQRIGNGPLQLHRRIRFLPDSRRNDCHHLPDNADGDCHAYR